MNKIFQSLAFIALFASVFSQITIPLKSTSQTKIGLPSRMLESSNASVSLTNDQNFQFMGPIEIGTPPQTFQVIFDTYYADTVVFSPTCKNCDASFTTYNASASNTSLDESKSDNFDFYSSINPATCEIYSDVISIAGNTLEDPEFLVVLNMTNNSTQGNEKYDGFFGMGYFTNLNYSLTPFAQLMNQQNLSKVFSFYYTNTAGENGSSVTLGGYDTTLAPNVTYHNVSTNNTWQLALDDFGYGNQSLSNNVSGLQVILTSGIPGIVANDQQFGSLLNQLDQYEMCYDADVLPNLYFTIGGIKYEVPPTLFYSHSDGYCFLLVDDNQNSNFTIPNGTIYLGIPFIQAYYSIFDIENQRIGFAANSLPTPTPNPQPLGAFRLGAMSSIISVLVGIVYLIL